MPRTRYMNATQAARELGRNEKTVRRWITEGKLQAERPTPRKLAIPESEINRVKLELEQLEQYEGTDASEDSGSLIERIEQLEQDRKHLADRIQELEQRVSELESMPVSDLSDIAYTTGHINRIEDRLDTVEQVLHILRIHDTSRETPEPTDARHATETTTHSEPRQKRVTEPITDMPEGTITITEFAERAGVKPRTFRDYFTNGIKGDKITDVIERYDASRNETKRFLTPEQQVKALDYLKRHKKLAQEPEQEGNA